MRKTLLPLLGLAAHLSTVIISIHAGLATAVLENQTRQVVVFWGRHKDEGSIREACDSGMYTAVIMSFLNVYGRGEYHLDLSGHPLTAIGDDIKHCQLVGVNVSLSIRGNYDSLPSDQSAALDLLDHVWNAYLGGSLKGVRRPFGNAKLDGVDLFVERGTPAQHYAAGVLARELAKRSMRSGARKPVHLTATLPCAFVSRRRIDRGAAIKTGVFDSIHVRFYNSDDGHTDCSMYSEQVWDWWAAAFPSSRIYLGLPASPEAAKEGYLYPKSLYYGVLPVVQKAANYGGVMLWDRYYDKASNYSSYVKRWA
ncbi:hypothetical protein BS78_05G154400 [Paspalum vaginatum]|nr:hypothetical protein BS78_05G154400 [Paspalum vaginatum]